MGSLADAPFVDQLVTRLGKLHAQRPRAWGRMTPHEMLCHPADSFQVALGERHGAPADTCGRHPIFGALTREEWLIGEYRHTDHHLRQFAL